MAGMSKQTNKTKGLKSNAAIGSIFSYLGGAIESDAEDRSGSPNTEAGTADSIVLLPPALLARVAFKPLCADVLYW